MIIEGIGIINRFSFQHPLPSFGLRGVGKIDMKLKGTIGTQDHNRRYKLILEIDLSKGVPVSFSPTRLIIFCLHADWLER